MRQLYGETFSESEMLRFKGKVRSSCLKHFISILHDFSKEDDIPQPLQNRCEQFLEEWKRETLMQRHFLDSGVAIWRILLLQNYIQLKRCANFQLIIDSGSNNNPEHTKSDKFPFQKQMHSDDPAKHFLLCFDRIMGKGYQPILDDILNLKDPTIGIYQINDIKIQLSLNNAIERCLFPNFILKISGMVETIFRKEDLIIKLIDVGGQRSERKKWLHYFDGVDVVIFVVAMSEYDQVLLENTNVSRMQESLKVFDSVCNNRWFLRSSILLFLNKKDVFDEKIVYSPIENCFPEYDKQDVMNIESPEIFIQSQFRKKNKTHSQIYCHYTNAKDTKNVKVMFDVIVDKINVDAMKSLY